MANGEWPVLKRIPRIASFVWIAGVSAALLLSSCDGYTGIRGVVRDRDGKALAGAVVKLSDGDLEKEVTTGEDGTFQVGTTHSPWGGPGFVITVKKEGYASFEKKLTATGIQEMVIVLDPTSHSTEPATKPPT